MSNTGKSKGTQGAKGNVKSDQIQQAAYISSLTKTQQKDDPQLKQKIATIKSTVSDEWSEEDIRRALEERNFDVDRTTNDILDGIIKPNPDEWKEMRGRNAVPVGEKPKPKSPKPKTEKPVRAKGDQELEGKRGPRKSGPGGKENGTSPAGNRQNRGSKKEGDNQQAQQQTPQTQIETSTKPDTQTESTAPTEARGAGKEARPKKPEQPQPQPQQQQQQASTTTQQVTPAWPRPVPTQQPTTQQQPKSAAQQPIGTQPQAQKAPQQQQQTQVTAPAQQQQQPQQQASQATPAQQQPQQPSQQQQQQATTTTPPQHRNSPRDRDQNLKWKPKEQTPTSPQQTQQSQSTQQAQSVSQPPQVQPTSVPQPQQQQPQPQQQQPQPQQPQQPQQAPAQQPQAQQAQQSTPVQSLYSFPGSASSPVILPASSTRVIDSGLQEFHFGTFGSEYDQQYGSASDYSQQAQSKPSAPSQQGFESSDRPEQVRPQIPIPNPMESYPYLPPGANQFYPYPYYEMNMPPMYDPQQGFYGQQQRAPSPNDTGKFTGAQRAVNPQSNYNRNDKFVDQQGTNGASQTTQATQQPTQGTPTSPAQQHPYPYNLYGYPFMGQNYYQNPQSQYRGYPYAVRYPGYSSSFPAPSGGATSMTGYPEDQDFNKGFQQMGSYFPTDSSAMTGLIQPKSNQQGQQQQSNVGSKPQQGYGSQSSASNSAADLSSFKNQQQDFKAYQGSNSFYNIPPQQQQQQQQQQQFPFQHLQQPGQQYSTRDNKF